MWNPHRSARHELSLAELPARRSPAGPESDYDALRAGKIVVTPLRYDRTDEDAYQALAERLPHRRSSIRESDPVRAL